MKHMHPDFVAYTYLDRQSDETPVLHPGVDLPVCSIMRSKYGEIIPNIIPPWMIFI